MPEFKEIKESNDAARGKRPGAGRKPGKGGRSLGRKKTLKLAFEMGIISARRESVTTEVTPPAPGPPPDLESPRFVSFDKLVCRPVKANLI